MSDDTQKPHDFKGYHSKSEMRRMEAQKPDAPREWWIKGMHPCWPYVLDGSGITPKDIDGAFSIDGHPLCHVVDFNAYAKKCEALEAARNEIAELKQWREENFKPWPKLHAELEAAQKEIAELKTDRDLYMKLHSEVREDRNAERAKVKELEEQCKREINCYRGSRIEIEELRELASKYLEALEFYANKNNWFETGFGCKKTIHINDCQSNCGGDIARQALGGK